MEQFEQYKPTLFAIAYKMTKSVADAEDIVQDVFTSFLQQSAENIRNTENYLVRSVMNRCFSLLEKQKQIVYPGIDLPEPLFHESFPDVQDIPYALLLLLQKLTPAERAVFILKETLDYGYDEIAEIVSTREENCRQLLHRAKEKIATGRVRYAPSQQEIATFVQAFMQTCASGDVQQLMACLKKDITIYSDGGGKVSAARHPIIGQINCIAFLTNLYVKQSQRLSFRPSIINGENSILFFDTVTGTIDTVMLFTYEEGMVSALYFIRNPDKISLMKP